ncbi:hypothetical protein LEP1GSC186_1649 [Leptospira noguchii serovar Autumnalis str. ZUN142]|uniref:Uncharacterized protein n=1 Tax=Leptospira noguchii serovar Autumnalis str. ZUN142 TaxID=1085540 RepID=M6UN64_9LEPT|nr:hypothetical protein LEP1GSC186_1649 [Leptospira noguchii serovar Autumnalis str. ZUN142]
MNQFKICNFALDSFQFRFYFLKNRKPHSDLVFAIEHFM